MLKFIKLILGLLLMPLAAALTLALLDQLQDGPGFGGLDRNGMWFAGGFALWLLLFLIFPKPMRTYVLGHELTHALWGVLMGARVSRLRVSHKGGSVTLNKSNVLITLAPYFFPFYMVLALITYLVVQIWWDTRAYQPFWYGLFGLCWSFHLCFTIAMLGTRQPDIHEHGRIFSYALIYCINLATAALLLHLLTARPLPALGKDVWRQTISAYTTTGLAAYDGALRAATFIRDKAK
jgi:hypothetical protein